MFHYRLQQELNFAEGKQGRRKQQPASTVPRLKISISSIYDQESGRNDGMKKAQQSCGWWRGSDVFCCCKGWMEALTELFEPLALLCSHGCGASLCSSSSTLCFSTLTAWSQDTQSCRSPSATNDFWLYPSLPLHLYLPHALPLPVSSDHSFLIKATSPSEVCIYSNNCVLLPLSYLPISQSTLTSTSTWQLCVHFLN